MTSWSHETVTVAGTPLHLRTGGTGAPLLILHHDIGSPDQPALHEALAARFTVLAPAHPGYDASPRPAWLKNVRDVAVLYQTLLADRGLTGVTCVGLGFGGWIAAEMATMAPAQLKRLVLVGAMGIKPERGDIMDQALMSYIEYIRAGFHDPAALERAYGTELPTPLLERWDVNRETTFRIAWRPYMFNPSLPHLLGGVKTPTLVIWGGEDRVVPLECGERYAKAMPSATLTVLERAGHLVDMERPAEVARAIIDFAAA
ncbi:MAG TPA: alpha/beta hydrolase [Methylomirabilota bacterium]|nr:alpha/beta hydrolase [Methylomirabilota bacterium]